MIEINEAWRFDGQEQYITYVVRLNGSRRMLREPVTTEWGKQLVALEHSLEKSKVST